MEKGCCTEEKGRLRFFDDELELEFDRASGRWLGLRDLSSGGDVLRAGGLQAPLTISVGGVTTATKARHHAVSVVDAETIGSRAVCTGWKTDATEQGPALTIATRDGDWQFEDRFLLAKGKARIDRNVRITYRGKGTALLRGMEIRVPSAWLGAWKDCFIEAPGYPTKAHQPLASVTFGEPWKRVESPVGHGAPGWLSGVIALDNPKRGLVLTFWAWDEVESFSLAVVRTDAGTRVIHKADLAARLSGGDGVTWEGQHLQLTRGDWHEALERRQAWFDEIGFAVPADVPPWARSARIYNCYVGHLSYNPGRYPDHDALIADLPRIRDLGFNVIYIMPHVPYPGYDSEDYLSVEKQYGSADGVRRLIERAHELGMRAMLDIGIHGIIDGELARLRQDFIAENRFHDHPLPEHHPYLVEHPEWFMKTEAGAVAATYTWAFDHANQGWRDFMIEAISHYVRDFGADSFRIDAPTWIPFPNWAEGLPYRASASIYGSAKLFEQARRVVHAANPEVAFYSEAPGPLFTRGFDLLYNYDFQWLFSALLTPCGPKGYLYIAAFPDERMSAADLGPWLEQVRLAKPRGATTVHHLDSGDTFGWSNLQYRREVFGVAAAEALFGFVVALGGPLMMYAQAEDGMEEYYRQVLSLKQSLPVLDRGARDFLAVGCDDATVFTVLCSLGDQIVVPAIRIGDRAGAATLRVPAERLSSADRWRVVDRMNGQEIAGATDRGWSRESLGALRVAMGPFQVRYLELVPTA